MSRLHRLLVVLLTAVPTAATVFSAVPARADAGLLGGSFHAVAPARLLDTRDGTGLGPSCTAAAPRSLGPGESIDVALIGCAGVPALGATAVVINTTVDRTTAAGYLTVWPQGQARPTASNLNWTAHQTTANLVEVGLGPDGRISLFNYFGRADVIIDVEGWVSDTTDTGNAGLFKPMQPARILDTRSASPLGAQSETQIQVAGAARVPATGAGAAVLNVTVTAPSTAGFLTLWPSDAPRPLASNLNFSAGQTVAARVMVRLSGAGPSAGRVSIWSLAGVTDVIVDVNGWFSNDSPGATGDRFVAVTPSRILDTRQDLGGTGIGPGGNVTLQVAGRGGLPAMSNPAAPAAIVANVTVTQPTAAGFLSLWPADNGFPGSSDLNFLGGQTVPNLVVVQLSAGGAVQVLNPAGCSHVVIDVVGWYTGPATKAAPIPSAIVPCPPPASDVPAPSRLLIPRIGVNAPVDNVGLDPDTHAQAPPADPSHVGWYYPGAAPGAPGHALIDGHVDWSNGPSVFYNLGSLAAGDDVWVYRVDGSVAHFTVIGLARFRADSPPPDLYSNSGPPQVWLITCTGAFNGVSYPDRLVVTAVPS